MVRRVKTAGLRKKESCPEEAIEGNVYGQEEGGKKEKKNKTDFGGFGKLNLAVNIIMSPN